jgi:hypothetical protein
MATKSSTAGALAGGFGEAEPATAGEAPTVQESVL